MCNWGIRQLVTLLSLHGAFGGLTSAQDLARVLKSARPKMFAKKTAITGPPLRSNTAARANPPQQREVGPLDVEAAEPVPMSSGRHQWAM
jgi:hypothetical protein